MKRVNSTHDMRVTGSSSVSAEGSRPDGSVREISTRSRSTSTIAVHAPSLGGVETLVSEPRITSHASLTAEQRAQAGIPDGFLRFSLGLEDPDDLIADFAQALARQ